MNSDFHLKLFSFTVCRYYACPNMGEVTPEEMNSYKMSCDGDLSLTNSVQYC